MVTETAEQVWTKSKTYTNLQGRPDSLEYRKVEILMSREEWEQVERLAEANKQCESLERAMGLEFYIAFTLHWGKKV